MFQFSRRFAFLSTVHLRNRTPKISPILTLYARANINEVNFFKHALKLIIFDTHNLLTFKQYTDQ